MTMRLPPLLVRPPQACAVPERRNTVLRLPIPRGPGVDLVDKTNSKENLHEQ
jgi:hypothetical protein